MPLINDADLLVIEPTLFVDADVIGTTIIDGTDGWIVGTQLASASSDFIAAGIDAGHVIVVNDEALEVVSVESATLLTISRPRASSAEPLINPDGGSALRFSIITFDRLITQAQVRILAALGSDPDDHAQAINEDTVVMNDLTKQLIAF